MTAMMMEMMTMIISVLVYLYFFLYLYLYFVNGGEKTKLGDCGSDRPATTTSFEGCGKYFHSHNIHSTINNINSTINIFILIVDIIFIINTYFRGIFFVSRINWSSSMIYI